MKEKEHIKFTNIPEVQLVYKSPESSTPKPVIHNSSDAHEILRNAWDENRIELLEEFKILLLNRRNACIGISEIALGGVTACIVDPRIIFATALKANATSIILSHNHPSGNLEPSAQDMKVTSQLYEAGKLLEIRVLEHIIMTPTSYYSMADNSLIP